ncbi:MAG: NfeD family protein [Prevotella sp.]|nr:NfeD family protein [Prevotella sp.]
MFEYLANNLWALWLCVAVVCLIIELTSFDFYVTCFAIGALGGLLGALLGLPLWAQALLWAVVSVLSICFVRPMLTRHLHKPSRVRASNAEALIGRRGTVIETIHSGGFGYVKIDGDEWRSVSEKGEEIAAGETVEVIARESIILTVRRIAK